jgi:dienelactone hydrolase
MASVLEVAVETDGVTLPGDLVLPDEVRGVVVFAHGSGSSRLSPRNKAVASGLTEAGFGTLLFDLLTAEEERIDARDASLRFDVALLARRLTWAIGWLDGQPAVHALAADALAGHALAGRGLPLGLFGASTGAAAALATAARRPGQVSAVVSRGGRPDLAGAALKQVRAPVLLIVGGLDAHVLRLNQAAKRDLPASCELAVVAAAGHLFEEPGALGQVTALDADWFTRHLALSRPGHPCARPPATDSLSSCDGILAVPEGGRRHQGGNRGRYLPGEHQAAVGERAGRALFGVPRDDQAGVHGAARGRCDRVPSRRAPGRHRRPAGAELRRAAVVLPVGARDRRGPGRPGGLA